MSKGIEKKSKHCLEKKLCNVQNSKKIRQQCEMRYAKKATRRHITGGIVQFVIIRRRLTFSKVAKVFETRPK